MRFFMSSALRVFPLRMAHDVMTVASGNCIWILFFPPLGCFIIFDLE